ncbi:hypothetical protein ABS642_05145 [Microbacterium sp. A8/3-1]|uniref:Uncharacterized protein n=1 Tax=Microbacterium sp. A8/3-1 TaxID=3160749 RepID=A0AAU7VZ47_9MICO
MADIDWNAEFAELAADRLEAEKATALTMQRRNSIEREHHERGRKLSEHERLRQAAIRLCRKAGVKGMGQDSFTEHTKNQLLNVIREAEAVISRTERG